RGLPPVRGGAARGARRGRPRRHQRGGARHRRGRLPALAMGPRRPGDHRRRERARPVPSGGRSAARGTGQASLVEASARPFLSEPRPARERPPPEDTGGGRSLFRRGSLLVAALVTRPAKLLAVLLLRHALAALLDD